MLTPRHRRARLAYAHDHHHWGRRQWTSVLWNDESRFCLHGSDRRSLVWRGRGERDRDGFTRPVTAFNGGSVMVWAGVSFNTRTPLVIVRGTLTTDRYVDEILRPHVLPMRTRMVARRFILMQDNARPHTAVRTRTFLRANNVTTLNHPAMSPDLNPIEHVWDMLGRRLRQDYPQLHNLHQLTQALLRCWQGI
ncbi:GSCOCG00012710001-RA-CDS [Cotesia congregata]|nr:GSCOCG00012710001-RA-CDS [Cotesia congregata]